MIDFWASIWENLPDWGPQMLVAAVQTLKLTAASFVLAVAFGIVVALLRALAAGAACAGSPSSSSRSAAACRRW